MAYPPALTAVYPPPTSQAHWLTQEQCVFKGDHRRLRRAASHACALGPASWPTPLRIGPLPRNHKRRVGLTRCATCVAQKLPRAATPQNRVEQTGCTPASTDRVAQTAEGCTPGSMPPHSTRRGAHSPGCEPATLRLQARAVRRTRVARQPPQTSCVRGVVACAARAHPRTTIQVEGGGRGGGERAC